MDFRLPPEIDALKQTMRRIVQTECIPLEARYLSRMPMPGEDEGAGLTEEAAGFGVLPRESGPG